MSQLQQRRAQSHVMEAIGSCRAAFGSLMMTSAVINLLMLTGALFMMQVYDRVLGSRSVPTLLALGGIALAAYLFQGVLDAIRARMLALVSERVDEAVAPLTLAAAAEMPLRVERRQQDTLQPFRDLDAVRGGLTGAGPVALLDLPWVPIYLAIVFFLHPVLGWVLAGGCAVLVGLAALSERRTRRDADEVQEALSRRHALTESILRGAEVIRAMGLLPRFQARWARTQREALVIQRAAAHNGSALGAASRALRFILQSLLLAMGAYLAIHGQMSAGAIIAGSIIGGRALAPLDQLIGGWKQISQARQAHRRLDAFLCAFPPAPDTLDLPRPKRDLKVDGVFVAAPGSDKAIVRNVSFGLKAGQAVGVIGASAAGKSTLARALVGVWAPARGAVRLDDAAISHWSAEALGGSIGFLPQDVQLFDGTIAENISRFDPDATAEAILKAAHTAGLHEIILSFDKGYDTPVGPAGTHLSAGQRQRLGLARALYGDPFLVVLDEPNANLDLDGENAVTRAILSVRLRGGIAVVVAHRPSALQAVDHLLVLNGGEATHFGPKDQVLAKLNEAALRVAADARQGVRLKPGLEPARGGQGAPPTAAADLRQAS